MNQNIEWIKMLISDETISRDPSVAQEETEAYYNNLCKAINIQEFPLVSVNTIKKRTYMLQNSAGKCYLVFDYYLLECMHMLNKYVFQEGHDITPFFQKAASEECYNQNKFHGAQYFAAEYLNHLPEMIDILNTSEQDSVSGNLFVQQAFLIAHEVFHFVLHDNKHVYSKGIRSKLEFLDEIYSQELKNKDYKTVALMKQAMDQPNMIEECLCDAAGVIQSIDVGVKTEKSNAAKIGTAACLALMNQFMIATIQNYVEIPEIAKIVQMMNAFSFRLVHLKAFTERLLEVDYSEKIASVYKSEVERIYHNWVERIELPLMIFLLENNEWFKEERKSFDFEMMAEIMKTLKLVFNS